MKSVFILILSVFSFALSAQNQTQPTPETLYEYISTGKDSGQISVKTVLGKDTTVQITTVQNVKNLAAEKAAQKAEVLRLLQNIDKEYDFLMDIFFNVRTKEENHKKLKK
jgi:hypothetical protein